jgi:hypothetical protein
VSWLRSAGQGIQRPEQIARRAAGEVHDGQHQLAPGQKGDQAPSHQSGSNDKGASGEVVKGGGITLPVNMMELFQQFVASIASKEKGKEVQRR